MNRHMQVARGSIPAHQRGAVLFVGLVFLVLLMLLAVTATNTSIMQERMTGGLRNSQLATSGAESALREAEASLWTASETLGSPFLVCGNEGLFGCFSYDPAYPNPTVRAFRESRAWIAATPPSTFQYSTKNLTVLTGAQASGN